MNRKEISDLIERIAKLEEAVRLIQEAVEPQIIIKQGRPTIKLKKKNG